LDQEKQIDQVKMSASMINHMSQMENSGGETEMDKIPGHSQLIISYKCISNILGSFFWALALAVTNLMPANIGVNLCSEKTEPRTSILSDDPSVLRRARLVNSGSLAQIGSAGRGPMTNHRCPRNFKTVIFFSLWHPPN
jgi:hypothetical protein